MDMSSGNQVSTKNTMSFKYYAEAPNPRLLPVPDTVNQHHSEDRETSRPEKHPDGREHVNTWKRREYLCWRRHRGIQVMEETVLEIPHLIQFSWPSGIGQQETNPILHPWTGSKDSPPEQITPGVNQQEESFLGPLPWGKWMLWPRKSTVRVSMSILSSTNQIIKVVQTQTTQMTVCFFYL